MVRHFRLIFETGIDRHIYNDTVSDIKRVMELSREAIKNEYALHQMKQLHRNIFKRNTSLKIKMEILYPGSRHLIAHFDRKLNRAYLRTYIRTSNLSRTS